ncbi:intradiol ring-cleavage dioxygenase [Pseudoxanthomonas sp.]|uniref:intradiol ring-cleavage dioxygenase n=1 Tax=Pseudoxanthomonas sp. TaxID=1871049 RepID=UPI00262ADE97|nr:intradiol ring-cleavage dioxygenase [Pseudoxanthomonas sp.]WDS35477.1 MAG: intradiol ring-cleavage dioxygenase [Pseudoxanthomonas sp.]
MTDHVEDHDRGLQFDLETIQLRHNERRRVLGWIASGGTMALLTACGGGGSSSSSSSSSTTSTSTATTTTTTSTTTTTGTSNSGDTCLVDPTETQGPYPADGSNSVSGSVVNVLSQSGIVRSDITTSFGDDTGTAEGLPLTLTITLVNVNDSCAVLEDYAIYLWHCTRDGTYSLYSTGILDQNYLRGVQETDSNGQITFTTIFPACYDGRWPHIHFEVYPSLDSATSYTNKVLTSQMAMDSDVCDAVYASVSGYSASVTNKAKVSLSSDNVFGDNSDEEIAWQTPTFSGDTTNGYTATITVGISA